MNKLVISAAFAAALIAAPGAALATSTADQISLCAAALDEQGLAAAADYRPKFVKSKGGSVKKITVRFIPTTNGAEAIEAECEIRRGEVVDVSVKA